jgi:hypothetical protein
LVTLRTARLSMKYIVSIGRIGMVYGMAARLPG